MRSSLLTLLAYFVGCTGFVFFLYRWSDDFYTRWAIPAYHWLSHPKRWPWVNAAAHFIRSLA